MSSLIPILAVNCENCKHDIGAYLEREQLKPRTGSIHYAVNDLAGQQCTTLSWIIVNWPGQLIADSQSL